MSTSETIESIQATLLPLEEMQGEHTQLESWVHDSFSALEKLHEELSEWQTELARKQTEIDLREDALEKCQENGTDIDGHATELKSELVEAREEIQQLEEENCEQLQEFENLELRHKIVESELKLAKQRSYDLSESLEAERSRTNTDQEQRAGDFERIRQLIEKQGLLIEEHLGDEKLLEDHSEGRTAATKASGEVSTRGAELKRRAQTRLAAKRRRQKNKNTEESD